MAARRVPPPCSPVAFPCCCHRKQAVSQAEAALTEAWKAELERTQQQSDAKVAELEAQVVRLMTQMEDTRREDARTVRCTSEGVAFQR